MRFSSIIAVAAAAVGGVSALNEIPNLMGDLMARANPTFDNNYPLGLTILKQITAYITNTAINTNYINISFTAVNPVPIPLLIDFVAATAGAEGEAYAVFNKTFNPPISLPASGTVDVPKFDGTYLIKGTVDTLPITNLGYLDVQQLNLTGRLFGKIPISLSSIFQNNVTANYDVDLSDV